MCQILNSRPSALRRPIPFRDCGDCFRCEEVGIVKGVHLLSGEVRSGCYCPQGSGRVQEEMQEVKDECEDEEVEENGGPKVEEIRSSCDDHEMTRTSETY